jgi:hypothetical protein
MKRKIYAPVTEFERATSYCPLYLAWRILDEARDYFRTPIPEAFADKLARRAEAVFAHQPFWARKASPRAGTRQQFEYRRQREFILMSMRHWLAGVLARERPALFRALPESFKIGHPLPHGFQNGEAEPPPAFRPRLRTASGLGRRPRIQPPKI